MSKSGIGDVSPLVRSSTPGREAVGVRVVDVPLGWRRSVRARIAGHGPVGLLLIHGWACSSQYWGPVLERLPDGEVSALVVDLPGSGGTAVTPGTPWSFASCAEMTLAAARALGIRPDVIVGHSMGGPIAAIAAATPECRQLILESYCPIRPFEEPRLERLRRLEEEGAAGQWLDEVIRSWFADGCSSGELNDLVQVARSTPATVLAAGMKCILRGLEDDVARQRCATATWIFGAAETNRAVTQVTALAQALGASLVLLEGVGHLPHVEDPERFIAVVLAQVRRLAKGGSDRGA